MTDPVNKDDERAGTVHLNIEAPGTNLLENRRTLYVFIASNLGFTFLFVWMMRIRTTLLNLQWQLALRGRGLA